MTPQQRELARHALGLPNDDRLSYRNHFVAGPGHADYTTWLEMVAAGYAVRRDGSKLPFGGSDMFRLTYAGAISARNPGETLDQEVFRPA